jgi:outer membrane protein OmpA-like peptidoglycan-associated protein
MVSFRLSKIALVSALVVSAPAFAESGRLNVNVDLGVGAPFTGPYGSTVAPGLGAAQAYGLHLTGGADYQLFRPFAIELLGGAGFQVIPPITNAYNGEPREYSTVPHLYAGIGPRLRFFDKTPGGNLWTSAHAGFHLFDGPQFGADAALGYQFGAFGPLSIGPFARGNVLFDFGANNRHTFLVTAGVSASFDVIPYGPTAPADRDGDGIADDTDQCADQAEDKDGFEDEDGCPDADNDKDGVLDAQDDCPLEAGVASRRGCPEPKVLDADNDGILDTADKCVDQPEDKDAFEDEDGCPDSDNDKDGIGDVADACPLEAGVPEERGCPVKDGDKDGVADRADNCPTEAGPVENQGCPAANKQLVVVTKESIQILDIVYFDTGKATIQARSFALLDQVAKILVDKQWIKGVRIEGHTDNQGKADKNQTLSEARANAVREYLIKKGVEGARLTAVGFGQDKPIASNESAKGRASNRRVEFKIVESE